MFEYVFNFFLVLTSLSLVLFFVIPYLFLYWKSFKNRFLFSGVINYPGKRDKFLSDPEKFGLEKTTNHTIILDNGGKVNLWLLEPLTEHIQEILVFYCHGASSNRGKNHRVEFYQVLQQLGYTIVAFDYRGFGDSKGTRANESSVIEDCTTVLSWTRTNYPSHHIIVWGHSLGSGISTKFVSELSNLRQIRGLVLESGFTSAKDAAAQFPAAKYWNYFRATRNRIPQSLEGIFPTIQLLPKLSIPVQLIHAVDDKTIPHQHSVSLRESCASNNKHDVYLFSAQTGEHRFIHRDHEAVMGAKNFIETVVDSQ